MSKLAELAAKPKPVKIGPIEFNMWPLQVKDLDLFLKLEQEKEKGSEALKEIMRIVLKKGIPEMTEDELDAMSVEHINSLMDNVFKINGFDTKDIKKP